MHSLQKISNVMKNTWTVYIVRFLQCLGLACIWGWSGGAMVLGKLPVQGRPTL